MHGSATRGDINPLKISHEIQPGFFKRLTEQRSAVPHKYVSIVYTYRGTRSETDNPFRPDLNLVHAYPETAKAAT